MKTILVPVGGGGSDAAVLETALAVARPLAAHLTLMHINVPAADAAMHTPHIEFATGPAIGYALAGLESKGQQRAATAEQRVREFCARHAIAVVDAPGAAQSVTASWRREDGKAMERLLFHARHHDLTVMARPGEPDGIAPDRLEALLMSCGRPLLITPTTRPMRGLDTVMVCWRETRDAARAVTAAMPLLRSARTAVVASVDEGAGEALAEATAAVARDLAWNGASAQAEVLPRGTRPTVDVLFEAGAARGVDLMVMGAYGHRYLREALFGGCTRSAIEDAHCAVLLMH